LPIPSQHPPKIDRCIKRKISRFVLNRVALTHDKSARTQDNKDSTSLFTGLVMSDLAQSLISAVEAADSSASLLEAVQQLAQAQVEEAIPTLIGALGYNNPGAAVAAVDGLIGIGKPAVQPLLTLLDSYNYGARAWALRALAGIGDPRSLSLLLDAAQTDFSLSVRRAAARGLGTIHWEEFPLEEAESGQIQALDALLQVLQDPEWIVRYAAITALQELAIALAISHTHLAQSILSHLDSHVNGEDSLAVIARIWLAQKKIHDYAVCVLAEQPTVPTLEVDWRTTLEKIYARKRQEQPLPEGDPRRFRDAAAALSQVR
jgi:phycocyanobilin lyase subunit beta